MSQVRSILKVSILIGIGWASLAEADPLPITGELPINTIGAGSQELPKTCSSSSGHVVVWQGAAPGTGTDIFARLYNASGVPVGPEFTINSTTAGEQVQPDVACRDDNGSFVVVWKGLAERIIARPFTAAGMPMHGEILVNGTSGPNNAPAVAYSVSGEFLVVWQTLAMDATLDIYGRVFNAAGTALTNETLLTATAGDQQDPAVAHIPRTPVEAFVVVWEGGAPSDIFLRRVCRVGGSLLLEGSELVVNSGSTTGVQENPDVAASTISPDPSKLNRIAVVWQGPSGGLDRIWYRFFDINNVAVAAETVADTDLLAGPQAEPSVSMPDVAPELEVQAIFTWSQGPPSRSTGTPVLIVGAKFPKTRFASLGDGPASLGSPANPEFEISVLGTATSNSDVAVQPNGDLVVAWQTSGQDLEGEGIYGRFFYANWPIFGDGFESGNTSAWSITEPLVE